MSQSLKSVIVEPTQQAKATVIWLHGLGADGHDFENIVPQFKLPEVLAVRFIFPHAPIRRITINHGFPMRSWCDILELSDDAIVDEEGVRESEASIAYMIQKEIDAGIPAKKIIIAGFSLGGAIAIHTALRFHQPLCGVIALSTFLPKNDRINTEGHMSNKNIPIFMAHGHHDSIAPLSLGLQTFQRLKNLHYPATWHEYPMEHSVCYEEINDISKWIQQSLSDKLSIHS